MGGEATALDGRRLRLHVRGAVQGVGFRPYVYGLATRYRLGGFVANDPHGVIIEVEGERASDFVAALPLEKPPLARIDEISVHPVGAMASEEFCIRASKQGRVSTRIVADAATCKVAEAESVGNLKRVWTGKGRTLDWRADVFSGDYFLRRAVEVKNVWVPYGD